MKHPAPRPLALALAVLAAGTARAALSDARWPQKQETARGTLVLYRPVIESWDDRRVLIVRQATSFKATGEDHRHYGAARIAVDTEVDPARATVTLGRRQLLGLEVPSLDDAALARAAAWRQENLSQDAIEVPVTQLLSWVDRDQARVEETPIRSPRPRVFLRTTPTQLVVLDGPPLFVPTERDGVEVLANSDTLIVRAARRVYLHTGRGWLEAPTLAGPWVSWQGWPTALLDLPERGAFGQLRRLFEQGAHRPVPEVLVSHLDVELVQLDGPPEVRAIPGTSLGWVTNTDADLFTHSSRPGYFLLVSGRWFHLEGSDSLGAYVSHALPPGFRDIPPDHPRAHVLASVPGTSQARDAVLATGVPRFRTVTEDEARFAPSFVGDRPIWRRIQGSTLEEATNSSQDVLRLGDRWLGCERGVWFESRAPGRRWRLLRALPAEVATIPPASAKHRLAYIDVVELEDGRVRVAVRSGYFGTYASGGVVVHGTGYDHDHTRDFYRDVLQRIRRYYDEGAADPLAPSRPSLLEPFYEHTYGYGFRYDPRQALFRPTRTGFAATRAARPAAPAAPPAAALSAAETAGQTIYPGADGRLYRRGEDGGWQRLGPEGWATSAAPPSAARQTTPGRLGQLPPAPEREPATRPVQVRPGSATPTPEATPPPAPKRIEGNKPPKIAEGYDAYRWTTQYSAPRPAWRVIGDGYPPGGWYPPYYPTDGYPTQYGP